MEFYFYDTRDKLCKPTSDEKLGNLLRAFFIRCAEESGDNVHKFNLFHEFRSDKTIRSIVHRAKSILAADQSFFSVASLHQRQKGPELHERLARIFVEQALERQTGEVITLTSAYLIFTEFLRQKSMLPVKRSIFKGMLTPIVRDVFNLGLRNDIIDRTTEHQTAGWKGLRSVRLEQECI